MLMGDMNVELVDHMGSDLTVVNAARVSFNKHSDSLSAGDEKLIKYLAKHNHWTPSAHCMLSFRIKAPIDDVLYKIGNKSPTGKIDWLEYAK